MAHLTFKLVNYDRKVLESEINLHGGLNTKEAEVIFYETLNTIIKGLANLTIKFNNGTTHVIKVVCGNGKGKLKKRFLEIF